MISSAASCRQCRQAGEKLFLKGARCRTSKCSIEKGLPAPGQHGKKPGAKKHQNMVSNYVKNKKLNLCMV